MGTVARLVPSLSRAGALPAWTIGLALAVVVAGCSTATRVTVPPRAPAPSAPAPSAPAPSAPAREQTGTASWYGRKHNGHRTASGETYNMNALTAAHPTLPVGARVVVTNLDNGRSVEVRINDRGPVVRGRIIDLSYAAARELGALASGTFPVRLRVLAAQE